MANRPFSMTRRDFLGASVKIAAATAVTPRCLFPSTPPESVSIAFPKGFCWGTAAGSYQVEGAWREDGKGESIWDRFTHTAGKVKTGDTGDVACDQYRRYRDDVQLMRDLGLNSYRFSISWPRIQPDGCGSKNDRGLDYYKRLIDNLLAARIRPVPALYHWDLPQALEDAGGWPKRDTAQRFADYADIVVRELGDRLQSYLIFNEPWLFTTLGYLVGTHAPGRSDLYDFLYSIHTVSLAQGLAFRAIKAVQPSAMVGTALGMSWVNTPTDCAADRQAAERTHLSFNVWFLEAAYKGRYPEAMVGVAPENFGVRAGDMEKVMAPLDFVALVSYPPSRVSATSTHSASNSQSKSSAAAVDSYGLREMIMRITKDYNRPIIEVTQRGHDFGETPDAQCRVQDKIRIGFLRNRLLDISYAIQDGADVRGYYISNLTDGFEWADGYAKRCGLAHVDFATQRRVLKESGRWYANLARTNSLL